MPQEEYFQVMTAFEMPLNRVMFLLTHFSCALSRTHV